MLERDERTDAPADHSRHQRRDPAATDTEETQRKGRSSATATTMRDDVAPRTTSKHRGGEHQRHDHDPPEQGVRGAAELEIVLLVAPLATSVCAGLEGERAVGVEDQRRARPTVEGEPVGDAAAGEQVVARAAQVGWKLLGSARSAGIRPRRSALRSRPRPRHSSRGSNVASTAWLAPDGRSRARTVPGRPRPPTPPRSQPAGRVARHGTDVARRHRLGHEDHHVARTAARACRRSRGRAPASAGSRSSVTTNDGTERGARSRGTTRLGLQRCSEIGRRSGASARNWRSRSRPSFFITVRSCVGLATPRAAANASAISSQ